MMMTKVVANCKTH